MLLMVSPTVFPYIHTHHNGFYAWEYAMKPTRLHTCLGVFSLTATTIVSVARFILRVGDPSFIHNFIKSDDALLVVILLK